MHRTTNRLLTIVACVSLAAAVNPLAATPSGVVVLHPTESGALTMTGNSSIHIPAHAVYVNSNHNQAIKTSGQAILDAPHIYLRGGYQMNGQASCTGQIHTTSVLYEDPFAGTSFPDGTGMTDFGNRSISGGANVVLEPGSYGSISVSGNSTVTFSSGTYVINSGLSVTSGCIIRGQEVTLVVRSGSVSFAGQADVELTPPGSGSLAGIVLAQPSTNTSAMSLSGGSAFSIHGTIYAPQAAMSLTGQGTVQGEGPQMGDLVVARTLSLSGLGTIRIGREGQRAIELMQQPLYD